MRSTYG